LEQPWIGFHERLDPRSLIVSLMEGPIDGAC
jgi:hypothetical protein